MLNQELRLLAFLALAPVSGVHGVPVNLIELCQVAPIFKVVSSSVRQREGPTSTTLPRPGNRLSQARLQMNNRALPATIDQFGVIRLLDLVEHD